MTPRFSLQPVLDFRHTNVEVLEVELGRLVRLKQEAGDLLARMRERQTSLTQELARSQSDGELDLVKVGQVRASLKRMAARIEQQQQRLEEMARREAAKRNDLVSAKKDEEALSTLKDKEAAKFKAAEQSRELRLQDDIYISQAHRKSNSDRRE